MSVTLISYCYDPPAWELGMGQTTCHSKIQHIMKLIVSSESHIKFNAKMSKLAYILTLLLRTWEVPILDLS
jgi:hypothetical protein